MPVVILADTKSLLIVGISIRLGKRQTNFNKYSLLLPRISSKRIWQWNRGSLFNNGHWLSNTQEKQKNERKKKDILLMKLAKDRDERLPNISKPIWLCYFSIIQNTKMQQIWRSDLMAISAFAIKCYVV